MADLISMLAACAGGGEKDPDFNQTVLLLHGDGTNGAQNNTFLDSSTNNFTITRNGNTTQGTFSPFSLAAGEWSNYFDGSGDRLRIAANAAFSFGTGDFTVEYWANFNVTTAGTMVDTRSNGTSTSGYSDYLNASSQFNLFIGNTTVYTSPTTLSRGVWYHIAVARQGTTMRIFINGALDGSITNSTNFSNTNLTIGDNVQDVSSVNGYLSNVRIVKGTAVYTAAFSVPTTPLTNITNTSILTCQSNRFVDNSTNAFSVPVTGNVRVTPFSPFAPTAAYSAGTNGGSGYFDGSGDTLVTPTIGTTIGTGDYCLEAWVYVLTGAASTFQAFILLNNSSTYTIFLQTSANQARFVDFQNPGSNFAISGGTINNGEWNHIVATRQSGNVRVFVNGKLGAYQASVTFNYGTAGTATIGATIAEYLAGVRITIGSVPTDYQTSSTTIGTQVFTSPTAPITTTSQGASNTQLLLNYTNAGIIDNTGKNNLETVGNAQIDTTTKKYGTGSLEFDGTGDWLLMPNTPDQQLGTGNFTIEFWVYLASGDTGSARGLVAKGTSTTGWLVSLDSSQKVVFTYTTSTITSSGAITTNAWNHIAVVRSGTGSNQTKIYIGGTNDGTGTVSTDFNQTSVMYVGANRTGGDPMKGFIDDLRITKGVARYTANFTPPTAAFPNE